ncbi:MAG: hypothetical protein ACPL8I_00045, partial [Chloroflexaceae bacterium]
MLSLVYLVGVLVLSFLALLSGKRRFALTVVAVSLLSNLASLLIYYLAPELSDVTFAVAARELTIYGFLILTFLIVRQLRWPVGTLIDRIYLVLLVFFLINIAGGFLHNGMSAALMGRELIFPLVTYFLFRFINLDERAIRQVLQLIAGIAVVGGMAAIIEQIYVNLIDPAFWETIAISGYLSQKYGSFDQPFPLSWVNYLTGLINRPPGMRSIGLMLDPLATGHFLACSLPVAYYWIQGWKRYIFVAIIFMGTVCTFSKASMLILFVVFGSQAFRIKNAWLRYSLLAITGLCVIALGILILSTGDDAFSHFGSFRTGVEAILNRPLGKGVGSTGYFNFLVTGQGTVEAVDTTFSVYAYQMGWPGVLALIFLVPVPAAVLLLHLAWLRSRAQFVNNCLSRLLMTVLPLALTYSLLAFSTAAAFTAVPVFIPMLLLGIYNSVWVRQHTRAEQPSRVT